MKKCIAILPPTLLLAVSLAQASGYRIPEQSTNAVALSNAYVAHAHTADAAYVNPANMDRLADRWHSELSFTWINLPSGHYSDAADPAKSSKSRTEDFLLPNLHLVSPNYQGLRFGMSVVYPFGLSKRWDGTLPRTTAEDFTLQTVELSPSLSYRVNEMLSIAGGIRILRADGEVRSQGTIPGLGSTIWRRDLEGDSLGYGYNLATTLRPIPKLALAATYRSKIDLDLEGDAVLAANGTPLYNHRQASVTIPAPAVLALAAAYTIDKTTVELVYDKTYWDAYQQLDFNYEVPLSSINPVLGALFDNPSAKNWRNTEAYRLGLSHKLKQNLNLMAGFAIDKSPVPDHSLGFDLPDSDSEMYSLGFRYQTSPDLLIGAAYLYVDKENRSVSNPASVKANGTFSDNTAHLLNFGFQYRF